MRVSPRFALSLVLALGWIPTLAVVCGARWIAGESLSAAGRSPIKITHLYTGPDGKTKVEEFEIPLKPGKPNEEVSDVVSVAQLQFRRATANFSEDWHNASKRQYVVNLSGQSEIEIDGGRKIHMGPGSILLAEDTTGKGHITRTSGSADRLSLTIGLADDATTPR
jgi:hypothetical protein